MLITIAFIASCFIGVAIILIGVRFMFALETAAAGYGIPIGASAELVQRHSAAMVPLRH